MLRYSLAIALSIFSLYSDAQRFVEITPDAERFSLKPYAYYYSEDSDAAASIEDILKLDSSNTDMFQSFGRPTGAMHFGVRRSPIWLRVDVRNTSEREVSTVVNFDLPVIYRIDMYQFSGDTLIKHDVDGNSQSLENREYRYRTPIFSLLVPPQQTYRIYFRFQSGASISIPATLYVEDEFLLHKHVTNVVLYILFGVYVGFGIYYLLIYIENRDWVYLVFSISALSSLIFDAYSTGEAQFFTPSDTYWNYLAPAYFSGISSAVALWFNVEFLDLRHQSKKLFYTLIALAVIMIVATNFGVFINTVGLYATGYLRILLPLVLCAVTIPWVLKGYTPAKIYLFGNIISFISIFLTSATTMGILPMINNFSIWSAFGLSLSFFVFAISMAYRIKQLTHSRQQAVLEAESARARDQAKSEFLAHMSHELRTPLNGVLGMVQLINESKLEEQQRKWIKVIKSSGQNLLNIVNDVLDYSKIEAGKLTTDPIKCNLREILHDVYEVFDYTLNNNNVKLTLKVCDELPDQIITDPHRFRQIVVNLVGNALKFTETGSVNIQLEKLEAEDYYRLTVSDTGIGLTQEEQGKLFSSFEQARTDTHRRFGGTGLGLAISKQLVELLGGTIDIASKPNEGSRFWIDLPLPPAPQDDEINDEVAEVPRQNNRALSILVAEDNAVNRTVIEAMLQKLGHHYETVENGKEAVNAIVDNHNKYEIILMDCDMPIMDGYQASKKIRAYETKHDRRPIPIVALTAHAIAGYKELSLQHGMNEHLSKPISMETLANTLNQFS